jgi:hypothetical protein
VLYDKCSIIVADQRFHLDVAELTIHCSEIEKDMYVTTRKWTHVINDTLARRMSNIAH